ncbi:FecR family protein [Achromobacter pestifer]|uniref:FecR family protein n=1 Tax=Achromobacter pestifer TaxID=1353889 RepID=A0A7D4I9D6_9BURK|nr:FecR family protein [Achromobacter pestifer]QKH36842.1 FecR family protein [Achromobacter pestifer]
MPRTDSPLQAPDVSADPVRHEAARWFARAHSGEWTAAAQAERDAWLAADPRHAAEYRMLESIWHAAANVPEERLRALTEEPRRAARPARRRALGLGLCVLAAAIAVGLWQRADPVLEYRTAAGERRSVTLPDGSTAELNSRSRIEVRFDGARRLVLLQEGEALFAVEKDAARPFIVDAGLGNAKVTGTRFDVRRDPEQLRIMVESGSVDVAGVKDQNAVPVTAGNAVRIDGSGHAGQVQAYPIAAALAWRKGQIVFTDTDLASAVREVSRHRPQAITLAPRQGLETLRLTSVFQTTDTDAFLTALPHILPVAVRRLPDGQAEIVAR